MSNYTSHASLEICPGRDETKIDDRFTTPLLCKVNIYINSKKMNHPLAVF